MGVQSELTLLTKQNKRRGDPKSVLNTNPNKPFQILSLRMTKPEPRRPELLNRELGNMCIRPYAYIHLFTCAYVYMYIYVYVCLHVHVYMYIHTPHTHTHVRTIIYRYCFIEAPVLAKLGSSKEGREATFPARRWPMRPWQDKCGQSIFTLARAQGLGFRILDSAFSL